MNDLITNINQATSDFNSIKQAIINKGVEVPQGTPTSQYGQLIENISGDISGNAEPLVLFEGLEDGYTFADGITGFDVLNDIPSGGGVLIQKNSKDPAVWNNTINVELSKSFSINSNNAESKNIDSAIFALNNEIDVTNFNYVLVDCFFYTDFSSNAFVSNMGGAYVRMGEPNNLPQSNTEYDWEINGWTSMDVKYNLVHTMFFTDISSVSGLQKIYIGVKHGTYTGSFSNILRVHKIILI